MSGRRRKSKRLKEPHFDDEFEQSFTVDEVKENLRTIGEKFLKWIFEGVQSEKGEKVEEMASSVRRMRNFLVERKKRIELSKSLRQLNQLETLSPLLDSANYLSSVAKNYLDKIKNRDTEKPQEEAETNQHDSSFVDMFLDGAPENAGENSIPQKDAVTEEHTLNMTESLKATPSRSILKTTFSETPGTPKKITFAKKATKVYEDNETSQISLAKSSGSVKSAEDYNGPKPPNAPATETGSDSTSGIQRQGNPRQASEDMFDDAESIVDTSFQEDIPKNVKSFKAKNLLKFTQENSKNEDSKGIKRQVNFVNGEQETESDPPMPQRSSEVKKNSSSPLKDPQTDPTLPFHNFRLTLPQDSSGSDTSLDARVNMAINLVNMKSKEPDLKQHSLPDKTEAPKNSTDGIISSSITCTDFRWMEPMEYNRETDSSLEDLQPPTNLPDTIFEEGLSQKHLLPPFDIQKVKTSANPLLVNEHEKTSVRGQENHPQITPSVFPPKATWANPFQTSITHLRTFHQVAQINPVELQPANSKDKICHLAQSNNAEKPIIEKAQENIPRKQEETPNKEKIDTPKMLTQPSQGSILPKTAKNSVKPQGRTLKKGATPNVSKRLKGTQRADMVEILQETYDSHQYGKTVKYRTNQAFKQALQSAVQAAKTRNATDGPEKQTPVEKEQRGRVSKSPQDHSKIARLRHFGKLWNDPSTSLPDTEINTNVTQSKLKSLYALTKGRSSYTVEKGMVSTKNQVKRRARSKQSQEEVQASSKEEKEKIPNKEPNSKCANNSHNPTAHSTSSTPLPDTILNKSGNDSLRQMNTSSMICETSFSGEKSSQGRRKQANSSQTKKANQKKTKLSQNSQKSATQKSRAKSGKSSAISGSKVLNTLSQKGGRTRQNTVSGLETTSGLASTSNNSGPQTVGTVGQPGNAIFSEMGYSATPFPQPRQPAKPVPNQAQQLLPAAQNPTSNLDIQKLQGLSLTKNSEHTESGFLKFKQLQPAKLVLGSREFECKNSVKETKRIPLSEGHQETTQQSLPGDTLTAQTELGFLKFQKLYVSTGPVTQKSASPMDISRPAQAPNVSVQSDPWLINLQLEKQSTASNKPENGGASFFERQPETTFAQIFDQPSNAADFNQPRQINSDWNFPPTPQSRLSRQNWPGATRQEVQVEPRIGGFNWIPFGSVSAGTDGRNPGPEMEKDEEPNAPLPSTSEQEAAREGKVGSQSKKRAADASVQLPKSPKMVKRQGNETEYTIDLPSNAFGTQGTEVLYEERDNLSWASDDLSTQTITEVFNSQNLLLSQQVAANSNMKTAENEGSQDGNDFQYEACTQLSWGLTPDCEESTSSFQAPLAQANYEHSAGADSHETPYSEFKRGVIGNSTELAGNTRDVKVDSQQPTKKKTEAEEIEELINSIKWVRRIPESELIEAANIDELINDQTFIW